MVTLLYTTTVSVTAKRIICYAHKKREHYRQQSQRSEGGRGLLSLQTACSVGVLARWLDMGNKRFV